jgi:benzoylformate decarboxylase
MGAVARTQKARVAEILLEILRSEGTQFIFGNPGTTELPLIDALVVNPDLRYVWGLQEATAVGMADGYAQASGKPAFVNLHTSGSLGHGMGAIMNAKIARVPMLITAGQQDLRHILADPLLAADLVEMAGPAAKWCFEPNSLDDLPLILRRAFYSSMSPPRGPVFLSLPMNILDEIGSPPVLPPSRIELASVGAGVKELALGLLRFDRFRTVIVAGNDIAEPGLGKAVARVAQLIGAPVYGASWPSVNNYSSIDPFWRGSLPTTAKGISEILGRYDCLLGLGGKSLVSIVYTMRDPIPESIEFYHISEDANDLGYSDAPKLGIFGNVRATLEALADELEPKCRLPGILKTFMLSQPQYNAKEHGFLAMDICRPKVDFQALARSMGVEATLVDSHRKISGAVEAALNTGKPHLIEVPVTGMLKSKSDRLVSPRSWPGLIKVTKEVNRTRYESNHKHVLGSSISELRH